MSVLRTASRPASLAARSARAASVARRYLPQKSISHDARNTSRLVFV
jgi:hypothetical protein